MDSPRCSTSRIPYPFLLAALFWIAGCAHQSGTTVEPPLTALPSAPFPESITGAVPPLEPSHPITEGTVAVLADTDSTVPEAPKPERASPPALGAGTLTELADAKFPSRGASLALTQEGRLAWLNHDPQDARQKLQSSLQIWGNNPYAHYYLGMLELEAGHYALATTFAKNAVRNLRPNPFWNARAYLLLAESLERSGDRAGAFEARNKAFELDPRAELR